MSLAVPVVGVFMETIDCDFAYIEHRMYMHQKYIRLFVSDIYAIKVCCLLEQFRSR